MSDCSACGATVRPDLEECENCGNPVTTTSQARKTVLGDEGASASKKDGSGLYRPASRSRKTQFDAADPFGAALSAGAPPRAALDPSDPFGVAATGAPAAVAPARSGGRKTMIDGVLAPTRPTGPASSGPVAADDPFARALEPAVSTVPIDPWPPLARPLVGIFVTFSGTTNGRVLPLTQGRTDIGRAPQTSGPEALIIDDDSVSSTHALITAQSGVIWFQDDRSANGTKIKSRGEDEFRLLPPGVPSQLKDGDIVQMGDSVLQFQAIDRAAVKEIWGG